MKKDKFIIIGENIQCTRQLKRAGKHIVESSDVRGAIIYQAGNQQKRLPIPGNFLERADWQNGFIKHCAVAIWQGMHGQEQDSKAGIEYLKAIALKQEKAGAAFLDVNVDEFSVDINERVNAMKWIIPILQESSPLPLSIDSSNEAVIKAGLNACDRAKGRYMLNSVSLERINLLEIVAEYKPAVIVSAAGKEALPSSSEECLSNLKKLIPEIMARSIEISWIYCDPLVYTISTDPQNGIMLLNSVAALRKEYGSQIYITGGLSNISFGMPNRKLINRVFTYLFMENGGDSGIIDPVQINADILQAMNPETESFKLAKALLLGEDAYGMNYISAYREGKLT